MSDLRTSIINVLDDSVEKFCKDLANKYGLNHSELFDIWKNESKTPDNTSEDIIANNETDEDNKSQFTKDELNKKKKSDLVKLCKEHKVKTTGKKDDLVDRLLNIDTNKKSSAPGLNEKDNELKST